MIKRLITGKQLMITVFTGILLVFFSVFSVVSQEKANQLSEESLKCLECHGGAHYTLSDTASGDEVKLSMYRELRVDPLQLAGSTHGMFKCTDCHSSDYETTPHPVSVKFESKYACIDCHGGDEAYASFKFETIEEEYGKSVHAELLGDDFSCWSCHNPHYYKLSKDIPIVDRVAVDNEMCLQCHGNEIKFSDLTERELPILIDKHDWLPNQTLHFKKVRCIDCHAQQNDSIMVAHLIKPSSQAINDCVKCHSTNSILVSSLYKHEVAQQRNEAGFYNGIIMNQAYLISANRNYFLNIASIVVFGLTLLAIAVHAYFRTRKSTSNASK